LPVLELLVVINANQSHSFGGAFEQRSPQDITNNIEKIIRVARVVGSLSVPMRYSLWSSTLRKSRPQRASGSFAFISSIPMLQRPLLKKRLCLKRKLSFRSAQMVIWKRSMTEC